MEKIVFKYKKETYQQKKYLDYNFIKGPITCPTFKNVLHRERIRIGGARNNPKLETWVPNNFNYHEITENEYLENYGKFNYSLLHNRRLIVIEEKDNKLSLKFFTYIRKKEVGRPYFKVDTYCWFVTYNFKTNHLYHGHISNYHTKTKVNKKIRRGSFNHNPINEFKHIVSHQLYGFNIEDSGFLSINELSTHIVGIFVKKIIGKDYFLINEDDSLQKFIMDKKGVKLPDNWLNFRSCYKQPTLKQFRKEKFKYIDSLMLINGFKGDKIRKSLHNINKNCDFQTFNFAIKFFGETFILSKDYLMITKILEFQSLYLRDDITSKERFNFTKNELNNCFNVFMLVMNNNLNINTFYDHLIMYLKIKSFEEIKWNSNDLNSFDQEHCVFSDKRSFYTTGLYERFYDENFEKEVTAKIINDGVEFLPIILKTTNDYNLESSCQSNCVKTYMLNPDSIIFSVRKNSNILERATVEYVLIKNLRGVSLKRVQSMGRFNAKLSEEFNTVLNDLDKNIKNYFFNNKNFKLPELELNKNGNVYRSKLSFIVMDNGLFEKPFWENEMMNETRNFTHEIL